MESQEAISSLSPYLSPAIIIAMIALTLQSIFSLFAMIHNFLTRKQSIKNYNIQYLTALLSLIDSLPIDHAQKASKKIDIIKQFSYFDIPKEIFDEFN